MTSKAATIYGVSNGTATTINFIIDTDQLCHELTCPQDAWVLKLQTAHVTQLNQALSLTWKTATWVLLKARIMLALVLLTPMRNVSWSWIGRNRAAGAGPVTGCGTSGIRRAVSAVRKPSPNQRWSLRCPRDNITLDELLEWEPYCGAIYPLHQTAGYPIICDRNAHGEDTPHKNSETGFKWWQ
jgi:hypothetical protein